MLSTSSALMSASLCDVTEVIVSKDLVSLLKKGNMITDKIFEYTQGSSGSA